MKSPNPNAEQTCKNIPYQTFNTYTLAHTHTHTHKYIHAHTYTHIHTHTQTYTYTHTYSQCGVDTHELSGPLYISRCNTLQHTWKMDQTSTPSTQNTLKHTVSYCNTLPNNWKMDLASLPKTLAARCNTL